MKQLLLIGLFAVVSFYAKAQVIFYVETPESLEGDYEMTWSDPANGWGSPDLNITDNSVTGTLVFAYDGTAADSLCCDLAGGIINGDEVFGNIAVVYRGSCQFGQKATIAEAAGAIAVVVINNVPGAPITPAAGDYGADVTIPLVIITQELGAQLVAEMNANPGSVTAFLGNKTGFYANDVALYPKDYLVAPSTLVPNAIAQNASEFYVPLGSWVYNFGYNDQTGIRMAVNITNDGQLVYADTSDAADLVVGDSIWFAMQDFSSSSYMGRYDISYSVLSDSIDDFVNDNARTASFTMSDSYFSYGALDEGELIPAADNYYRPSATSTDYTACIYFRDPNASRLFAEGIHFSATTLSTDSLTNEYFETILFEWNDAFVDLNDANLAFDVLDAVAFGEYVYDSNLQQEVVYSPFEEGIALTDNQRYLFCVATTSPDVYIGFSSEYDYDERLNYTLEAVSPVGDAGTWYAAGFGTEVVPAFMVKFTDITLGTNESSNEIIEAQAFPNPSSSFIQIPLGKTAWTTLEIYDQKGALVHTESVSQSNGLHRVNTEMLDNGVYNIRLVGSTDQRVFNVLVSK
jgi:hypothetical protein